MSRRRDKEHINAGSNTDALFYAGGRGCTPAGEVTYDIYATCKTAATVRAAGGINLVKLSICCVHIMSYHKAQAYVAAPILHALSQRTNPLDDIAAGITEGPLLLLRSCYEDQCRVRVVTRHVRGVRGAAVGR